ncbi:PsbP domain-containing protein 2, chloroplastic [Stylosanthes scabra]|uniref:PsbP domain-containing protein 2, chloroplastic n=1 Tax=Stylosanthes scabra TaxID=79078 RepID=A0ABU6Z1W0_9FABA|nr:PsbP domain-containing protein 2, chloroplastic [Stylosanthes scabra]
MALKICFTLLHNTLFHHHPQHSSSPSSSSSRTFFSIPSFNSSTCVLHHESHNNNDIAHFPTFFTKRKLNLTLLVTTFLWSNLSNTSGALLMAQELELELQRYTDSKEGFTLLVPSSWTKVDKAGATALFQDASMGSNNIGVVVNPVRLASLGDFGSPEFVADKLLQAERRKESTKEAELVATSERSGDGGLQIYEFEYTIDSTRGGKKRIFSAAFVTSKKLYLLNIAHSDKPENPLEPHKRKILEQVLHSFDSAA